MTPGINSIVRQVEFDEDVTFLLKDPHSRSESGAVHFQGFVTVLKNVAGPVQAEDDKWLFGFVVSFFSDGKIQCDVYQDGTIIGHLTSDNPSDVPLPESGNERLCKYVLDAIRRYREEEEG